MAAASRIPVYLLTGFLGSGKTTLLSAWLGQPALRGAAVIVNELGEVGLDGALLGVTEQAALVSGSCVCCTGLPGLEQALEDLFWARLQRRMPAFPAVAIETTGMADPAPIVQAFHDHPLLRERYRLQTIITVAGAPAGAALLDRHPEARAQVRAARVLIMTKTREAGDTPARALAARLATLNPGAPVLCSNQADLTWEAVSLALAPRGASPAATPVRGGMENHAAGHAPSHDHGHGAHPHAHHHAEQAHFLPLPHPIERDALLVRLHALADALGQDLLRLKGVVALADGRRCVVQFAPDERRFDVRPLSATDIPRQKTGLTVIATHADPGRMAEHLSAPLPSASRIRSSENPPR
ncbi:GTP-binding protein [Pigmentiphaga sp.]|uniref:CobW family GTP-binding protein n=1 Tax=Pigmentiphaga sp. TaxID=1977564 RepID=UPI002600AB43|nr:GTP-binding protein [Pigmentiphaga sp.]